MANKTVFDELTVKRTSTKAIDALKKVGDDIRTYVIDDGVKSVAQAAQIVAQLTLDNFKAKKSTSQQLSPSDAAYEVGVRFDKSNNSAYVYAPINPEYKDTMYYLEYGAGLHSTKGTTMDGENWIYPIKDGESDIHKEIGYPLAFQKRDGISKYSLGDQAYKFKGYGNLSNKWFGVTNTSKPVKYMQAARRFIQWNARPSIVKSINIYLAGHTRIEYIDR